MNPQQTSESLVREIRRKTRKKYSSEEKIRIVLDCLKGEESIAEICRREGRPARSIEPVNQFLPSHRVKVGE